MRCVMTIGGVSIILILGIINFLLLIIQLTSGLHIIKMSFGVHKNTGIILFITILRFGWLQLVITAIQSLDCCLLLLGDGMIDNENLTGYHRLKLQLHRSQPGRTYPIQTGDRVNECNITVLVQVHRLHTVRPGGSRSLRWSAGNCNCRTSGA